MHGVRKTEGCSILQKRARIGSLNTSIKCYALPTYIFFIISSPKKVGCKERRAGGNGRLVGKPEEMRILREEKATRKTYSMPQCVKVNFNFSQEQIF